MTGSVSLLGESLVVGNTVCLKGGRGEGASTVPLDTCWCRWPNQFVRIRRVAMSGFVVNSAGISPWLLGILGSAPDRSRISTIPAKGVTGGHGMG